MGLDLNFISGLGRRRLASLQRATPERRASRVSPGGRRSPRVVSIHVRRSAAAWGV